MKFDAETRSRIEKLFNEIREIDMIRIKCGEWDIHRRTELFLKLDEIYGVA